MFNIIKANITLQEAEELYLNDGIVMLFPSDGNGDSMGDVIYVGDVDKAFDFIEPLDPPEGYSFFVLHGLNLRELTPIIEVY
jgi:hypothetical protein